MDHKPKKIYGSMSGFAWGKIVFTKYKTACYRNILLTANGVREGDINPKYVVMGKLNEDRYETYLKNIGAIYDREYKIEHSIIPDSTTKFSGRADFIRRLPGYVEVEELKSTDSSNKRTEVIKKGKYVVENLAQAVAYMVSMEATTGRLVYTYYEKDAIGNLEPKDERAFELLIDQDGRICVEGTPSNFSVNDLLTHRLTARRVVDENLVWDERPHNSKSNFESPCKFCPWSSTCDKFDKGTINSTEQFIEEAKKSIKVKETAK